MQTIEEAPARPGANAPGEIAIHPLTFLIILTLGHAFIYNFYFDLGICGDSTLGTVMPVKTLQIAIKSIPETGLEIAIDLGPEWFARWREADPGLEFADVRITGHVSLAKHGHDILVRGHLSGQLDLACSRCLESFAAPAAIDFDLLLVPGPPNAGAEDEELSPTDLDLDYYTGEIVDLESLLREQIILMLPLKPLCDETCKGLCPQCGANLNRETCQCKTDTVNSPFAHLAKVKI
jgi:uncharacterized protein